MYVTSNDRSQNIFVYQATFNTLELKIGKNAEYVIGSKSKRVCNFELIAMVPFFLTQNISKKKLRYYLITFI